MQILNEIKGTIVLGIFVEDKTVNIDPKIDAEINELISKELIKKDLAKVNKFFTFGKIKQEQVCLIGLGEKSKYKYQEVAKVSSLINRTIDNNIELLVDSFIGNLDGKEVIKKMLLTINDYTYKYEECKSQKKDEKFNIKITSTSSFVNEINEVLNLSKAINNTKDLVNKPYNYLNAVQLANYAENLVKELNSSLVKVQIYNKKEIEKLEMNAFLGVNKGSVDEPRLIHLTYYGNPETKDLISFVGKGITFDTGGYSLKTSMNTMKDDMAGAATSLGIFEAVVKNNLKVNIQVVICATDNRVNGEAYLPDDVLTAMNKKTIEIVSTDAEGRLTLADAITFAQKQGSKEVIDLATLTGACVVALGEYTTGIFGNDEEMIQKIIKIGDQELEHVWELPITDYIREKVRSSKVADLTNSTGRNMGASGAAAFLEAFVEENVKWVHLDIAGTAFRTTPAYNEPYGATGVMVKTLYAYIKAK